MEKSWLELAKELQPLIANEINPGSAEGESVIINEMIVVL